MCSLKGKNAFMNFQFNAFSQYHRFLMQSISITRRHQTKDEIIESIGISPRWVFTILLPSCDLNTRIFLTECYWIYPHNHKSGIKSIHHQAHSFLTSRHANFPGVLHQWCINPFHLFSYFIIIWLTLLFILLYLPLCTTFISVIS